MKEKEKKIKAYILLAKCLANPKTYSGRKYRVVNGRAITIVGKEIEEFVVLENGEFSSPPTSLKVYISISTEVEEVL